MNCLEIVLISITYAYISFICIAYGYDLTIAFFGSPSFAL